MALQIAHARSCRTTAGSGAVAGAEWCWRPTGSVNRGTAMKRLALTVVFLAACITQMAWVVFTQTAKPARPVRQEKVKDNLYVLSGEGGNVAVYVTIEGVILV